MANTGILPVKLPRHNLFPLLERALGKDSGSSRLRLNSNQQSWLIFYFSKKKLKTNVITLPFICLGHDRKLYIYCCHVVPEGIISAN